MIYYYIAGGAIEEGLLSWFPLYIYFYSIISYIIGMNVRTEG